MTGVYIAIQKGVYRHAIVGCCSSPEKAQELGRQAIEGEEDHYHDVAIILMIVDGVASERLLGELVPVCEPSRGGMRQSKVVAINWETAST